MGLAERLNKALAIHNLQIQSEKIAIEPEFVEPEIQECLQSTNITEKLKPDFGTLVEAIENADSFEPDEFGTRLILVKEIDIEEVRLPLISGKYIIDDIQKREYDIYEVHLVENGQKY